MFEGTGNVLQESANLAWNNTTQALIVVGKLGINNVSPLQTLDMIGGFRTSLSAGNAGAVVMDQLGTSSAGRIYAYNGSGASLNILLTANGFSWLNGGNFAIGTTTDAGFKLDVNGTARVKGTGTSSATSAFTVQNSAGTNGLNVQDDGKVTIGRTAGAYIEVGSLSNFHNTSAGYDHVFRSGGSQIVRIVAAGGIFIGSGSVNASAVLQADSTTKGFLPPRMTNAQRLAIATPAVGLIVYCTDAVEGLYVNKSTGWTFVI